MICRALGVLLYTIVFGERPFVSAEEILSGRLHAPRKVESDLWNLIAKLLNPDAKKRLTIDEVSYFRFFLFV